MSDDDKIVIPIEVTGDDEAKAKIEGVSETLQRVIAQQSKNAGISTDEFQQRREDFLQGGTRSPSGEVVDEPGTQHSRKKSGGEGHEGKESSKAPNLEQLALGETGAEVGRAAEGIRLFREILHTLHPAFGEAGISITELTALTRAASGGVIALAGAIGGLLVTALEKASDETNTAANRLGTFAPGGSDLKSGQDQIASLQDLGHELKEFPTSLAASYEQLQRINQNQPPDQQQTGGELREVLSTLVKGTTAERVDPQKSLGAITELLKSVRENGFFSSDSTAYKAFQEIAPRTAAAIVDELNKKRPGASAYSDQEFLGATQRAGPKISQNLAETEDTLPGSIEDAWHHVKVAADRLSQIATGGHVVASSLEAFSTFLDTLASAGKTVQDHLPKNQEKPALGLSAVGQTSGQLPGVTTAGIALAELLGTKVLQPGETAPEKKPEPVTATLTAPPEPPFNKFDKLQPTPADISGLVGPEHHNATIPQPLLPDSRAFDKFQPEPPPRPPADLNALLGPEHHNNGVDQLNDSASRAAESLDKVGEGAGGVNKTLEDFAKAGQLGDVSKDASKKNAAIDLAFEPSETASKLAKDQIAVQNADIHQRQAVINGEEAQKNVEKAALAPAQAAQTVKSAQGTYDDALAKFFKGRGVDTRALEASNKNLHETDELDAAALALKRAKIDQKYSYLDRPKAELAAEQSETAIKSAAIEKQDSSLKLAKDQYGAPVTHELAQLRYAQAALDFDKVKIELLGKILQTLNIKEGQARSDVEKLSKEKVPDVTKAAEAPPRENKAGPHTVEDDRKANEKLLHPTTQAEYDRATQHGFHTVEGDRKDREGEFKPAEVPDDKLSTSAVKLSDSAGDLKDAASQLKAAAAKSEGETKTSSNTASDKNTSSIASDKSASTATSSSTASDKSTTATSTTSLDKNTSAIEKNTSSVSDKSASTTTSSNDKSETNRTIEKERAASAFPDREHEEKSSKPEDFRTHSGEKHDIQGSGSQGKAAELDQLDKFAREHPGELKTNKAGEALNPTAEQGFGKRPRDHYDQNKMLSDQKAIGEYEGDQANKFTKELRDQLGGDKVLDKPFDKMGLGSPARTVGEQHGIVPHPDGGKADLSEKLDDGSHRYRYIPDANYQPPEFGSYDKNMGFVPSKHQPYPRMRQKPYWSDKPYSRLEDTFDEGGDGKERAPIYNSGQPNPLSFPGYNKSLRDDVFPKGGVPTPAPRPPEAPQQQLPSSPPAAPQQPPQPQQQSALPQQMASLDSTLQSFLSGLSALLSKPQDTKVNDPATGGIRGDAAPAAPPAGDSGTSDIASAADGAKEGITGLVEAIQKLAGASSSASGQEQADASSVSAAEGGYIRGPGTTTSDDINAKLSDREFVHPATATEHYGLPFMEAVRTKQFPKPSFALGGLFTQVIHEKRLPGFALGGMFSGMRSGMAAAAPSLGIARGDVGRGPASAASQMEHWGTVDLRHEGGDSKIATERDTMRHLSAVAQRSKRFSTGTKPAWYGG